MKAALLLVMIDPVLNLYPAPCFFRERTWQEHSFQRHNLLTRATTLAPRLKISIKQSSKGNNRDNTFELSYRSNNHTKNLFRPLNFHIGRPTIMMKNLSINSQISQTMDLWICIIYSQMHYFLLVFEAQNHCHSTLHILKYPVKPPLLRYY